METNIQTDKETKQTDKQADKETKQTHRRTFQFYLLDGTETA